jgi:hypothetical protein
MELSPSSETASCATTQEFSSILWNLKIHCCVHNSTPLVPILSQMNLVHTTQSYLPKMHLNSPSTYAYVLLVCETGGKESKAIPVTGRGGP